MRTLYLVLIASLLTPTAAARADVEAGGRMGAEYNAVKGPAGIARTSENWLSPELEFEAKPEAWKRLRLKAKLVGEFLVGSNSTGPSELNCTGSPQFLEDQELFLEFRGKKLRFSLGSRVLRWGVSDLFDPLDQINSRRYERPLKSMKRGEWMLFSEWRGTTVSFEAFAIPEKRGAILPSTSSAWLPRQIYVPNLPTIDFQLPNNLEYRYRDREVRDDALRWNTGARLQLRPGDTEISLQYDEGASSFPSIRPSVSGTVVAVSPRTRIQADPLIQLTEVYYRERHWGGSVVQTLPAEILTRVQIAKTEPMFRGRELAHDRSDVTLSLERGFSLGAAGQLTLLAQGFRNLLADDSGGNDLASFSKLFDQAAALGLRYAPTESTSVSFGSMHSFASAGGQVYLLTASIALSDSIALELDGTLIEAPQGSPIGAYDNNDGGSAKLIYSF